MLDKLSERVVSGAGDGAYTATKHFVLNDRIGLLSAHLHRADEQTMRELYLRPFGDRAHKGPERRCGTSSDDLALACRGHHACVRHCGHGVADRIGTHDIGHCNYALLHDIPQARERKA